MTQSNRSLTLDGANKIFSAIDIQIGLHEMGYYCSEWKGQAYQEKTLTKLCQKLLQVVSSLSE